MEPACSLPHSQEHATCPYHESDQSSPCPLFHLKTHFNIVHICVGLHIVFVPQVFTPKPCCISPVPHVCNRHTPSQSSWCDHPNNIWWWVQIIKTLIIQSSPLFCYLVHHQAQILSSVPSTYVPPWMWETKFHTHSKQQAKLKFCISYPLYILVGDCSAKDSAKNDSRHSLC